MHSCGYDDPGEPLAKVPRVVIIAVTGPKLDLLRTEQALPGQIDGLVASV